MMIVALTAQGASFFHVRAAYPRSAETVKLRSPVTHRRDAGRHLRAVCCLPGRKICRQKVFLRAAALGYSSSRFQ